MKVFLVLTLIDSSSFLMRNIITSPALMPSAITVAMPTPATLISQTITKKRFKRTFTIPEITRQ